MVTTVTVVAEHSRSAKQSFSQIISCYHLPIQTFFQLVNNGTSDFYVMALNSINITDLQMFKLYQIFIQKLCIKINFNVGLVEYDIIAHGF